MRLGKIYCKVTEKSGSFIIGVAKAFVESKIVVKKGFDVD